MIMPYWQACLLSEGKFASIYTRVDGYVFWEASCKVIAKVIDGEFDDLRDGCMAYGAGQRKVVEGCFWRVAWLHSICTVCILISNALTSSLLVLLVRFSCNHIRPACEKEP